MALEDILYQINKEKDLNKDNVIEKIKEKLKAENEDELKEAGFDVNKLFQDEHITKFFLLAAQQGCTGIVKALIDVGVNVDVKDGHEYTPLHLAGRDFHLDTVKALIDAGADVNQKDGRGVTLLHYAALVGYTEMVKALIDAGANVNVKKERLGWGPLYCAALKGHTKIVKALIDAGADINEEEGNDRGHHLNVLFHAFVMKKMDIVELIVSYIEKLEADGKHISELNLQYKAIALPVIESRIFLHNHSPLIKVVLNLGYHWDNMLDTVKICLRENKDRFAINFGNPKRSLIDFVDFEDVRTRHVPRLELCAAVSEVIRNLYKDKAYLLYKREPISVTKKVVFAGGATALLGTVAAVALFATGTIAVELIPIVIAVATIVAAALAVGYMMSKPSTEMDEVRDLKGNKRRHFIT